MELKQAQQKILAAIAADAEAVIAKAIAFRPGTEDIVAAVRKARGTVAGIAAAAIKYACAGDTPAESGANIIRLVETF